MRELRALREAVEAALRRVRSVLERATGDRLGDHVGDRLGRGLCDTVQVGDLLDGAAAADLEASLVGAGLCSAASDGAPAVAALPPPAAAAGEQNAEGRR